MGRSSKLRWAVTVGLSLALAGCGGSGRTAARPDNAALKRGLLTAGELANLSPVYSSPVHGAAGWAAGDNLPASAAKTETARLRRIGFVAGISEQMQTQTNRDRFGLTLVEQFSSTKGPPAELARSTTTNGPFTTFPVPGVPGGHGFEQDGATGGRNIAFVHGNYYYLIGSGWQGGAANGVPRAKMIAVAGQLYRRVAG